MENTVSHAFGNNFQQVVIRGLIGVFMLRLLKCETPPSYTGLINTDMVLKFKVKA